MRFKQRLAGCTDHKGAGTECSRTNHFLGYINMYDKCDVYLTDKKAVTREIIEGYTEFLLQGFTIFGEPIVYSSIIGYLKAVNKHYTDNDKLEPFSLKDQSNVAKVLKKVTDIEKAQKMCGSLSDEALAKMLNLMIEDKKSSGFQGCCMELHGPGNISGLPL